MSKPRIAIVPGDPAGIGPELIAKLLNDEGVTDAADIVLVGDSHLWQRGAEQAERPIALDTIMESEIAHQEGVSHLEMETITPQDVKTAEVSVAGGTCLLYTSPSPRDLSTSRMPSSA